MNKNRIIGISIVVLIMGILLIVANLYIDYNLRKYSVYYAHNMEHKEGTHPEMAMALENDRNKNNGMVPSICATYVYGVEYLYSNSKDKSYIFNSDFSLKAIYNSNTAKMEYGKSDIDEEELYKEVYKNFGFLVEANVNRKPLINMQKEFNKKYYKRFN